MSGSPETHFMQQRCKNTSCILGLNLGSTEARMQHCTENIILGRDLIINFIATNDRRKISKILEASPFGKTF